MKRVCDDEMRERTRRDHRSRYNSRKASTTWRREKRGCERIARTVPAVERLLLVLRHVQGQDRVEASLRYFEHFNP
jgi:hypothetical protein